MKRISIQVSTHILPEEVQKLDEIVSEYKFKSRYQLIQTIIRSFLRVADPEEDEVVCNDIEEMFEGYETSSTVDFDTTKRKTSI